MSAPRGWKELPLGGLAYRLSTDVKTGDWRALKPVVDHNKCTKCMLCWLFCPDMAIVWDGRKYRSTLTTARVAGYVPTNAQSRRFQWFQSSRRCKP